MESWCLVETDGPAFSLQAPEVLMIPTCPDVVQRLR